jgi:hypothetical protein
MISATSNIKKLKNEIKKYEVFYLLKYCCQISIYCFKMLGIDCLDLNCLGKCLQLMIGAHFGRKQYLKVDLHFGPFRKLFELNFE